MSLHSHKSDILNRDLYACMHTFPPMGTLINTRNYTYMIHVVQTIVINKGSAKKDHTRLGIGVM